MRLTLGLMATFLLAIAMIVANTSGNGSEAASEPAPEAAAKSDAAKPSDAKPTTDRLIVHEWGTFTSFSGSDSVKLEFRPLVDVDLPFFVFDRGRQAGVPRLFGKFNLRVLQRMETPVTYFYTDRARQVNVRVGFPQGLLTEFYPPVQEMLPKYDPKKPAPLTDSMLDWGKVWIIPDDRLQIDVDDEQLAAKLHRRVLQRLLPQTYAPNHYAYARETDSALVYVEREANKKLPLAPRGAYFEKFLFYRGVGNFELPLELSAQRGGRFELTNLRSETIRSLFLVTLDGDELRFVKYDKIDGGERLTLEQSEATSSIDELSEAVVQALIDEKLYEKEARAMVKTWKSSWFGEQGTRLFYMLPQSTTDQLLPLDIQPTPDEMVRVMVGRMEIMRPEDEARITELVKKNHQDRVALAKKVAEFPDVEHKPLPLPKSIIALGRLGEPALVRVKHIAKDAKIRTEADYLLSQLRSYRNALAAAGG